MESTTQWLTDSIINATQNLLKKKYATISGLQNTLLGQTLGFKIMKEEFVQVLHTGGNHWITVATIGCPPSSIRVYDSLNTELPFQTKEQICAILHSYKPFIDVEHINVQDQMNAFDCGVFALAFVTALCAGQNPENLFFTRKLLRPHLLKCLENEDISPFPCTTSVRAQVRRTSRIEIFCQCRTQEGGKMAECTKCREWYHDKCTKIPDALWSNSSIEWNCDSCRAK